MRFAARQIRQHDWPLAGYLFNPPNPALNVRPIFVMNDAPNLPLAHIPFPSQGALADAASGILGADIADVTLGVFGTAVPFATANKFWMLAHIVFVPARCSAFAVSIVNVFSIGANEKVARVTATRSVAMMTNQKAGRDGTVAKSPGGSVGTEIFSSKTELAITLPRLARLPRPALTQPPDAHFYPKPKNVLFAERRDDTVDSSHDRLLVRRSWSERLAA